MKANFFISLVGIYKSAQKSYVPSSNGFSMGDGHLYLIGFFEKISALISSLGKLEHFSHNAMYGENKISLFSTAVAKGFVNTAGKI